MVGAARLAALRQTLASFDVVGVVERFEETLLLLADMSGLRELEFLTAVKPHKQWCGARGCKNEEDKSNAWPGCPPTHTIEECRAAIREAAPIDHLIYDEAVSALDERVCALPPLLPSPYVCACPYLRAPRACAHMHAQGMLACTHAPLIS